MVRIKGSHLPDNKRVEYGLTYVYGIGLKSARDILNKLKISFDKRVKELSDEEVATIEKEITASYVAAGDLHKRVMLDIQRLREIGSYRGLRHRRGLPVRGQRTKTNARTRKGPRGASISLKKAPTKK